MDGPAAERTGRISVCLKEHQLGKRIHNFAPTFTRSMITDQLLTSLPCLLYNMDWGKDEVMYIKFLESSRLILYKTKYHLRSIDHVMSRVLTSFYGLSHFRIQ